MTIDEACQAASRLLEERGQLLNGHLLRLVEGDKSLFRDVREALIRTGHAEDRSGVGLIRPEPVPFAHQVGVHSVTTRNQLDGGVVEVREVTDEPDSATATESDLSGRDWWLMASGVIKGPFELQALRRMRMNDEIGPGDVVRRGTSGLWCQPGDVLVPPASDETDQTGVVVAEPAELPAPYVPPPKAWTAGDRPVPHWFRRNWMLVAEFFGGTRRLLQLLFVIAVVGAFSYWWRQPPPVSTIYKEFTECARALQKLRERRVGRSEWAPTVNRLRPRVQSLVDRLQYRGHPVQKELFYAGKLGLLPLLDIPANPADSERIFDKHMTAARLLLDGDESEKSAISNSKSDK